MKQPTKPLPSRKSAISRKRMGAPKGGGLIQWIKLLLLGGWEYDVMASGRSWREPAGPDKEFLQQLPKTLGEPFGALKTSLCSLVWSLRRIKRGVKARAADHRRRFFSALIPIEMSKAARP